MWLKLYIPQKNANIIFGFLSANTQWAKKKMNIDAIRGAHVEGKMTKNFWTR